MWHTTFLSPLGALIVLVVILPLGAAALRERRAERVRRMLGLEGASLRAHLPVALAAVGMVAILALAAAQPALRVHDLRRQRTDAEAYLVMDISRSMMASAHRGSPTRLARAISAAQKVGAGLPDVPVGVATLTDRVLPDLLPTVTPGAVSTVLAHAIAINQPPPSDSGLAADRATSISALQNLGFENFFAPRSKHKLIVLFSDGESTEYYPLTLVTTLQGEKIGLMIVRLWGADERIYSNAKKPDPYRSDQSTTSPLQAVARLEHMPRVYDEHSTAAAVRAARAYLGTGPTIAVGKTIRTIPLDRYVVLAAAFPLGFALARRNLS